MPTFTDFIPTFPTVNRKFLITDFRLLSTSVKPENFIDFYRSQKKVKDPRCLGNAGGGNNRNRNGKYCFYCKIQNHTQEECRKRMKDNKPCKDKQGRAYWPKVYVTSDSQERDPQGQQPVFP